MDLDCPVSISSTLNIYKKVIYEIFRETLTMAKSS